MMLYMIRLLEQVCGDFFCYWQEKMGDCVTARTTLLPGAASSGARLRFEMIPKEKW